MTLWGLFLTVVVVGYLVQSAVERAAKQINRRLDALADRIDEIGDGSG